MKNRLLTLAGALALLVVLGKFYAKPLLAQAPAVIPSGPSTTQDGEASAHAGWSKLLWTDLERDRLAAVCQQ